MRAVRPGINIQYPISQLIVTGDKTIETRTYPIPKKYAGRELYLIETPGPTGQFKARVIAIIKFGPSFQYPTKRAFYADYDRHKVGPDSQWSWKDKPKWGWPILSVTRIPSSPLKGRQGIRFASEVHL